MSVTAHRRPVRQPLRAGVEVPLGERCATCRDRHGGEVIGPLCLEHARIAVAKWSAGMLPTIRGMDARTRELLGVAEDDPAFRKRFGLE